MDDIPTIENKEQFDNYFKVENRKLGPGGFGAVYPVLDKKCFTVAAVKRILTDKHNDNEVRILFLLKFNVGAVSILKFTCYIQHLTID